MAALLSDPGVSPTVLLLSLFAIRLLFGFACMNPPGNAKIRFPPERHFSSP